MYFERRNKMPLIVLGLIVLVLLLIYAISDYMKDNKKEPKAPKFYAKLENREDISTTEEKTLLFPTDNVETEKKKRNIH